MRTGRSYVATAVALGIITLSGCAAETADEESKNKGEDWGDPDKYPELGGAYHSLTAFSGTCTFVSGAMVVTATAGADQSIIIGKRAVDSAILVNGSLISGCTTATSQTLKTLKVVATTGDQVVILDFLGGLFAPGIATARGISIDLGANTGAGDEVRVRGTSAADSWVFGSDGLAVNTDAFRDIDFTGVEKLNFSLGAGNDVLTGTVVTGGLGAGKGVTATATVPFTVFGGDGNDVLTGGDRNDKLFGGPGADTLAGGGTGAGGETDLLSGQEGADVITQGAANNGPDKITCGIEAVIDADNPDLKDTVTYALRGTPEARVVTSAATLLATDSERIQVALVPCTETVAGTCDTATLDGYSYKVFTGNSGQVTEAFGSLGTLVAAENDAIDSDCEIIVGGMDNDVLTGSDPTVAPAVVITGSNTLAGGPGDDVLTGGLGDDVLSGDDGADLINEGTVASGADVFNGGAGVDTVNYGARLVTTGYPIVVTMDGLAADDGFAGELDDVQEDIENLIATAGADKVTGNKFDNVITGGLGIDELDGAAGNDTFDEGGIMSDGDKFVGGLGTDTVDYSKRAHSVWVTMAGEVANDGEVTFTAHATTPVVNFPKWGTAGVALLTDTQVLATTSATTPTAAGASLEGDTVMEDVENVNGSLVADVIVGNALNNSLDGGPGGDFLFGEDGDDTLFGGASVTPNYNEVTGLVDINYDTDITDNSVATADADDYLWGGNGADTLDGSISTANKLVCGGGDDVSINQGASGYRDPASCES